MDVVLPEATIRLLKRTGVDPLNHWVVHENITVLLLLLT